MLFNIFGKNKSPKAKAKKVDAKEEVIKCIQQLKRDLLTLDKKESHLTKTSDSLKSQAIELKKNKNNKQALQKMKLYKLKQKQLDFILNSKIKLEQQINTLEQSINNNIVISSMKTGRKVLGKMKDELNVDEISDLIDDIQEKKDDIDEVSKLLSEPSPDFDEDELLAELEEDELEMTENELLEFPAVPTGAIIIEEDEEESDDDNNALRELEAEFA